MANSSDYLRNYGSVSFTEKLEGYFAVLESPTVNTDSDTATDTSADTSTARTRSR